MLVSQDMGQEYSCTPLSSLKEEDIVFNAGPRPDFRKAPQYCGLVTVPSTHAQVASWLLSP